MPGSSESEQHRYECECRYWNAYTNGDKQVVAGVIERIAKKRGRAAADKLLDGMRKEWKR